MTDSITLPAGTPLEQIPRPLRKLLGYETLPLILHPKKRTEFPRQCFALDPTLTGSLSIEEVDATFNDMVELGIAKPPYDDFDLLIIGASLFKATTEELQKSVDVWQVIFRYGKRAEDSKAQILPGSVNQFLTDVLVDRHDMPGFFSIVDGEAAKRFRAARQNRLTGEWTELKDWEFLERTGEYGHSLYKCLLVLLATRNIEKELRTDKLAKLGIGKKSAHRYTYTTTLRVPAVCSETVATAGIPSGASKRPHLRRGHIRRQHFGPRNSFEKKIWIEPLFVNADEDFISARTAYNITGIAR